MYLYLFIIIGLLHFDVSHSLALKTRRNATRKSNSDPEMTKEDISRDNSDKSSDTEDEDNKKGQHSLESAVNSVNTGVKQLITGKAQHEMIDTISKAIIDFAKKGDIPVFRSNGVNYDIKKQVIQFKSGDKPSVRYEINSNTIVNALKDVLKSKTLSKYFDTFIREAAVIYRAFNKDKP